MVKRPAEGYLAAVFSASGGTTFMTNEVGLLAWSEGANDFVLHRRQTLEEGGDRVSIRRREIGEGAPRHDRREFAAVGTLAGLAAR
jgi:hypothetical protein